MSATIDQNGTNLFSLLYTRLEVRLFQERNTAKTGSERVFNYKLARFQRQTFFPLPSTRSLTERNIRSNVHPAMFVQVPQRLSNE